MTTDGDSGKVPLGSSDEKDWKDLSQWVSLVCAELLSRFLEARDIGGFLFSTGNVADTADLRRAAYGDCVEFTMRVKLQISKIILRSRNLWRTDIDCL